MPQTASYYASAMILDPSTWSAVRWPADQQPLLVVSVDAEAEFDWTNSTSRKAIGVRSIKKQRSAHRIFARFGIRPTYLLDFPVSSAEEGYRPIRELLADGECEIGAHLQPWDNPPFLEELNDYTSYPGNLAPALEREKLKRLTGNIERNLGRPPRVHRAGRYGVGRATGELLIELGYEVDMSVLPTTDLRPKLGPDFRRCDARPYWVDAQRRLFEIPLSIGFTGLLARFGPPLHTFSSKFLRLHTPGILARLRLLDRITLTPEGIDFFEMRRLTRVLFRTGHRVFSFSYHGPSLEPGNTPYVQSQADLAAFMTRMERYFDFFMNEIGGRAATPLEVKALAGKRCAPLC